MAFDIALGITADALNLAAGQVYELAHRPLLVGSRQFPIDGLRTNVTLDWDIAAAPVTQLPTPDDGGAEIRATLPLVAVGVAPDDLPRVILRLSADVDAEALIDDGGLVTVTPRKVLITSADLGQPLQTLLDGFLLPRAMEVFGPAIPRCQLPPAHVGSLAVSPPKVVTQGDRLVAAASLAAAGPSQAPAPGTAWPDGDLFALVSADLLQAAVAAVLNSIGRLSDHGDSTAAGFGFEWHYDVSLTAPRVVLHGQDISLTLRVSGTAGAGVVLFGQRVDATFGVRIAPDPGMKLRFSIDAHNHLVATVDSMGTVVAIVTPESVGAGILEALTAGMISAIGAAVSAAVSTFLHDLRVDVAQVPDVPVTIAGVTALLRPRELAITSFDGLLAVAGAVDITHV